MELNIATRRYPGLKQYRHDRVYVRPDNTFALKVSGQRRSKALSTIELLDWYAANLKQLDRVCLVGSYEKACRLFGKDMMQ